MRSRIFIAASVSGGSASASALVDALPVEVDQPDRAVGNRQRGERRIDAFAQRRRFDRRRGPAVERRILADGEREIERGR